MYLRLLLITLILTSGLYAQEDAIYNDDPLQKHPLNYEEPEYFFREPAGATVDKARVEPPFWWTGMAEREVEILLYDQAIRDLTPRITYPGVEISQVTRLENPNYLFLTIDIGRGTTAGSFMIELLADDGTVEQTYPYGLRSRVSSPAHVQGLDASDFIYLIMPDRFANGDTGNDSVEEMAQQGINRDKVFFRHGGDLIGVMEHLDYLEELGVTALWLNPVMENDQPSESYHGYAVTDHYQIDRRLGTNEQYRQLVELAHTRGMKVIMDVIFNHVGDHHWFIQDIPSRDWIHQSEEDTETPAVSYRAPVHMDPHAASADFERVTDGWFDKHMPDLNQGQPQLANYLIQNSIWWTEYTGQDAFRIDTYAYCDQSFMAEWNRRLLQEYPEIGIFAETWVHGPGVQSWFPEGLRAGQHQSYLPGVTDYQMYYSILEAIQQEQGWTSGTSRLYYTLAQDYLYEDAYRNVLFLDNHDLDRVFGVLGEDINQYKSAISLLMTMRGIPMMYYGTEILMIGGGGGGFAEGGRLDFPGGWRRDDDDKFRERDRTEEEQNAYTHVQRLAQYRKQNAVLHDGHLTQYIPEDGLYVYFRHNGEKTVMIAYNSNEEARELPTDRFADLLQGYSGAMNILTGESINDLSSLSLDRKSAVVLELR